MAADWAPINLGEVCTKIGSGATPRGGSDVYLEQGPYSLIRSQNIYNDGFHRDGLAYIGESHAAELANVEVQPGDVLLNITGDSVARVCQVDPAVLPARVNQHVMIIRPDPNRLDPKFLRYFLVSPDTQSMLLSWAGSGGTRNALTKSMIESFDVLAPNNVSEQRAIAHILGTLDDKIELNRRMSETLEAMARALFKSWFVDFEPVRAKAKGRPSGLPRSLDNLFPDSLQDSDAGEMPKGWEVRELGHCLALLRDGSHNPPKRVESGIRFLAGATDVKHFYIDFDKCTFISEVDYSAIHRKWTIAAGDVLLTIVGTVGNVAIVSERDLPFSLQRSIAVLRPGPKFTSSFLYCLLLSAGFQEAIRSRVNPTAQPGIYLGALGAIPVCIPPTDAVRSFDRIVSPMFSRMQAFQLESRTLSTLRDFLLPRLLAGELIPKFISA